MPKSYPMIYFIYGDDFNKTREKLNSLISDMVSKKPNISLIKINEENIKDHDILNLVSEQGLFENEMMIVFHSLFGGGFLKEDAKEYISLMKKSKNIFIVFEGLLDKKTLDLIKKGAGETFEFFIKNKPLKVFNPFALGDALGEKNKKLLWVSYYKALSNGASAEELHGMLFWQIKSILIAKLAKDATESGLKPFVYGKAKRFASKFKEEDLRKLGTELVQIYDEARKGITELAVGLEKFILKI